MRSKTQDKKSAKKLRRMQGVTRNGQPRPGKPLSKEIVPNESPGRQSVQQLLGGRGQDINTPANSLEALREQMVVSTMSQVLPVNCTVNAKTISNTALGIILHALKHGLSSAVDGSTTNPFYMYRYLVDAFNNAMQGTIPAIQQAPVWFWELCYAIRKKQASFKLTDVNYSWVFNPSSVTDDAPIPMGVGPEAYSIFLTQSMTQNVVLGFPALGVTAAPYTSALGEASIANLWAYTKGSEPMTKLIGDPGDKAFTYRDTSAFAVVYPELGGSFETPNALKSTVYSERNIDSPLLAKFAGYQPEGTENWRGWHKAGVGGGSSCLIGPTLMNMTTKEEIRGKVSPIVKFFNFDEFFEVLSLTLGSAASPQLGRAGVTPIPTCPLSPIQVQILLRQTIIPLFSNECCQDLRLTQSSSELILPFTVGQNGVSMGTKMLLPTFLAENIRACKSFSNRIRQKDARTTLRVLSVLGRPSKPQLGNYLIGSTQDTIYTEDGNNQLINLIDCSSILQNQVLYLDLTREQIQVLESKWNAWITLLSTNLSPLVSIGQTDGVSILKTITYTNFQSQLAVTALSAPQAGLMAKAHSQSKLVMIPGLSREFLGVSAPLPGTGYFDKITEQFTTSLQVVPSPVWKYLSLWILPVAFAAPSSVEEQSIQGWSAFFIEAYRIPRSTRGGQGSGTFGAATNSTSTYDRHVSMAQIDVKSIASDGQNELIEGLLKEGDEGRGSFLDAIASLVGPAINAFGLL